jgi:DNA polymerase-3 subunit epsilon
MLKLERPFIMFDLETTTCKPQTARIVSMAFHLLRPEVEPESFYWLVNPTVPIPPKATKIHGITDEMVKGCPTFKQRAKELEAFLALHDMGGYNCKKFDIPVLHKEFELAGIEFNWRDRNIVDACNIFKKKEERNLTAAVEFYCGRVMTDAHNAAKDAEETWNVLRNQTRCYADLSTMTVKELAEFSELEKTIDLDGKLGIDEDGDYIYKFGDKAEEKVKNDPGLARWMLSKDFSNDTKNCVRFILKEIDDAHRAKGQQKLL